MKAKYRIPDEELVLQNDIPKYMSKLLKELACQGVDTSATTRVRVLMSLILDTADDLYRIGNNALKDAEKVVKTERPIVRHDRLDVDNFDPIVYGSCTIQGAFNK